MSSSSARLARIDTLLGPALIVAGLAIAFESASLPKIPAQAYGPGFFPQWVGYALSASGVLMTVRALLHRRRSAETATTSVVVDTASMSDASGSSKGSVAHDGPNWPAIVWVIGGLALIAVAMNTIGFLILVPVFLLGYLWLVGEPLLRSLIVVGGTTALAWYSFAVLLKVQIPPGLLELLR